MTNILVECPNFIASVRVGILNSLEKLRAYGKCCVKFIKTIDIKKEDICWADILIIVRGCEPITLNVAKAAKKSGRMIAYFLDDDLLNIPKDLKCSAYFEDPLVKESMKELLALSDVLWYVNPMIGEIYGEYFSGRHLYTRIAVTLEETGNTPADNDKINILYVGSVDHEGLIRKYLCAPAEYIAGKYGNRVTFTFVGADPHISGKDNIRHYSYFADYDKYSEFVKNGNFHIGLAPIETSRFYKCKYLNKFIDYTRFGIVGIYTDSMPYTMEVINGVNGFLTENTTEKWIEAIEYAVNNPDKVQICRSNAEKLVKDEFNIEKITVQLLKEFSEIVNFKAPAVKINEIKLPPQFISFVKQRITLLWREHHLAAVFYIAGKAVKFTVKRIVVWSGKLVKRLFSGDI